jgi:GH18 family chitinase
MCNITQAFNNETLNSNLAGAVPKDWTVVRDGCYKAPYAVNGPYWIGYEDLESTVLKAQFTNTRGLGGAMVFSLDQDDFRGDYGPRYTLTQAKTKEYQVITARDV